ncbi:hypothetical protein QTP88_029249 [Uroleucon formosanum]
MSSSVKRKQFSLEEKKNIISEVDNGLKKGEVAKKYGISPSTLSTILKNRESILKQLKTSVFDPSRKRMRKAQFEDVDTAVYKWFQDVRSRNVPLTGPLIREKALEFAKMLEVENFQASVGCDVPMNSVNEWRNGEVAALIKKYNPDDVFNADEAGVFFQLEPKRTLAQKGDKCVGGKASKQRITALFCCNKSGTEKRKILIIGKSAKPRCFKNCKSLPCIYKFNKKAWMTQIIFNDWLIDFDTEMKKKRKILLLIDNIMHHQNWITFVWNIFHRTVQLYFNLLTKKNIQRKCNVKEAIEWICGAWDDISQSTITNCWKHATTTKDANSVSEVAEYDESNTHDIQQSELEQIWITAKKKTSLPDDVSLKDYLGADDVSTCYELTEVDIVQSIKDSKDEATDESSGDEDDDVRNVTSSEALSSLEYITTLDCDKEINVDDPGINKQSQALEIIPIYSSTLPITETKTSKDNIYLTEQFIPKNDFVFPKTNGRSCQLKWFNSFSWLHYVKEKNVVLCNPCALASQTKITKIKIHGQESFIDTGFQNWKKGTERFSIHEKSENHRASIEYLNFRNNSRHVISLITEQSLNEQKEARTVFKIVISSIRYLARSGQAIRGGTWDSGNLIYLLQERSLENPALKIWLEKRNNWLSGDIQNELLETMAHFVLRKIKNSVLKCPFMAIMVDGTTDISGQEQFSICFRFLNIISLNINEIFVGMYNPPSGNAETLFSCITDLLTPLSDTIKTVDFANDTLNLIRFVSNTILDSSKRKNIFSGIVLSTNLDKENDYKTENIPGIIPFCPTRWTVRVKAVNRFIENYERVLLTIQDILKDSNSISKDGRAALRGYETKLWKFETVFALESLSLILGPCEQLAKALQNISYTAIGAKHSSELLIKTLTSSRNDDVFNDTWNKTKQLAVHLNLTMPKNPTNIDKKVALRKEFFALIDCLLNELNERFTQSGLDKVVSMETILMRSINRDKIEISEIKKLLGIHVTDFNVDQLAVQLIMLPNILNFDNPSATIKDIVEIFKMLPETSRQLMN